LKGCQTVKLLPYVFIDTGQEAKFDAILHATLMPLTLTSDNESFPVLALEFKSNPKSELRVQYWV